MVTINAKVAVDLVVGVLQWPGPNIDYTDPKWSERSGIKLKVGGETVSLLQHDIFGGYVGSRASKASVIVQPSIRTPTYAETQLLPVKVSESFIIAVNVISSSFAKGNQDQLLNVCDAIQERIDMYRTFALGAWDDIKTEHSSQMGPSLILDYPQVWEQDGEYWMMNTKSVYANPDGTVDPMPIEMLGDVIPGENYMMVSSVDYNDEITFGTHRGAKTATIYVTVFSNQSL